MNWMEQRNEMFHRINDRLAKLYVRESIKGQECFRTESGLYFRLFEFSGENALCIEYAENYEEAVKNLFEDGDRFYLDEMSEDEVFDAMVEEIEN